jgi:hypothetical protein
MYAIISPENYSVRAFWEKVTMKKRAAWKYLIVIFAVFWVIFAVMLFATYQLIRLKV